MKKLGKFASVAMALAMVATMGACGSAQSSSGSAKTLTIGGIGPLTGDYANYGTSNRNGAQLAVDEINKAGGVNGFELKLDFQDSQGNPDSAVSAYGKLMDSGMDVSLGATFSGETQSVVAAAKADKNLVLTPTASSKACIEGNDCAFCVCFNDPAQGTVSADYIADNKLGTKVAVFYASDNDYSKGLYDTFKAECAVKGLQIVETQTFTTSTNTDFSTQINAIKASGADLVFMPIYAAEAANFLTQASGKLNNVVFFGCDGLDGILTKISDTKLVEGVMMLTPFAADAPEANVQSFVTAYKAAYNSTPDQFAADGYDAVYTIKAALEKAGVTADNKDDTFNAKMVAAMTQITVKGVTGTMTWTADGETNKAAKAMVFHSGVATVYQAASATNG